MVKRKTLIALIVMLMSPLIARREIQPKPMQLIEQEIQLVF